MNLIALPAFVDNYIWMIHDGHQAWAVDPGTATPVIEAITAHGLELAGILVTHHHGDHVGGIEGLRPHLRGPVVGPATEDIPAPFEPVRGGGHVDVLGARFDVLDVPGHTAGHIAYLHTPPASSAPGAGHAEPLLFCGDTLFSGGCGRLFEGTPEQMHGSLSMLAALPADTAVCCAHEYTVANLRFALAVEPGNPELQAYARSCAERRERGEPTLPSRIGVERAINPFLRCDEPEVVASARRHDPEVHGATQVFRVLREWKNGFR